MMLLSFFFMHLFCMRGFCDYTPFAICMSSMIGIYISMRELYGYTYDNDS